MVLPSISLFTVSALAYVINNAVLAETLVVDHACKGEAFCSIKPDNYPQEEIDRLVIKHLPRLHRMKRDAPRPQPAALHPKEGNCRVNSVTMMKPFTYRPWEKKNFPFILIQSKWFEQEVPFVTCSKEGDKCFDFFSLGIQGVSFECRKKQASSNFFVYDPSSRKINNVSTNIDLDCGCMRVIAEKLKI